MNHSAGFNDRRNTRFLSILTIENLMEKVDKAPLCSPLMAGKIFSKAWSNHLQGLEKVAPALGVFLNSNCFLDVCDAT